MSISLDPFGNPIQVGNIILRTPGLAGQAESHPPGTPGMRAAEQTTDSLEEAFTNEHIGIQETIEVWDTREIDVHGVTTRSTAFDEPAIEVQVPDAGDQWGQFVLYTDEAGVTTWNFARDEQNKIDVTRGAGYRTYTLRRYIPPTEGGPETRGLIGAVGKKLIKVLVFPLLDPVVGAVGNFFAARWEQMKRPYRMRTFSPANYGQLNVHSLIDDDWSRLSKGRVLLMMHGTLSRAHVAFGALPQDYVASLHQKYEGRVFAFDHFTLSDDPKRNVERLIEFVPDGTTLDLDIVCHSRGGLVARQLAEKQREFSLGSRTFRVRRIVFVAVPNAGTILTDTEYLGDFLDSYTNLLNFIPDNGATEILEGLITVGKQLTLATMKGLEGLQSMLPNGQFLQGLNRGVKDEKRYFALSSHFEPTVPGWKDYVADRLMDKIFKVENDLIVPMAGVYDQNGSDLFPISNPYTLSDTEGVSHTSFFRNAKVQEKIMEWLSS